MAQMPEVPDGLIFTNDHVWLKMIDDYTLACGVSAPMLQDFSMVLFIDLPQVNLEIYQDEKIVVLESDLDIYYMRSPVSGRIVRTNSLLLMDPGLINSDPYNNGWILEIELKDRYQLDDLMDYEGYLQNINFR